MIRIATDILNEDRIETVDFNAKIGNETGIEIKLINNPETFTYVGDYAKMAYDALVPHVVLHITSDENPESFVIFVRNLEWVNLNANINGVPTVEISVITDEPLAGIQQTRKLTGKYADCAYEQLIQIAPEFYQTA